MVHWWSSCPSSPLRCASCSAPALSTFLSLATRRLLRPFVPLQQPAQQGVSLSCSAVWRPLAYPLLVLVLPSRPLLPLSQPVHWRRTSSAIRPQAHCRTTRHRNDAQESGASRRRLDLLITVVRNTLLSLSLLATSDFSFLQTFSVSALHVMRSRAVASGKKQS